MNVITRGVRNAFRSPVRSVAILAMLAISTGLVLAMLVARTSVNAKIDEVKSSTATQITINPAGFMGGMGGGDALTAEQVTKIKETAHIDSVVASLTDQLGEDDTNLTPSLELGNLGKRLQRFDSSNAPSGGASMPDVKVMTPRTTVTGTTDPSATVASDKLTSGEMIDGSSSDYIALIGSKLAEKNELSVGETFTMHDKTFTVKGIYTTDNEFQDSGLIIPLATLQTITDQAGAVSSVTATADSSDNVATAVADLKTALGDKADITSQQEQAENSVKPLESIANLALAGVIGAAIAGSVIVLLSMIMIVRERRREIGVIKAIGGTNRKVIGQFVSEALTLTVIGGIIGLGIGIAASGPMTQSLVSSSDDSTQQGPPRGGGGAVFKAVGSQLQTNVTNVTSSLTAETFAASAGIIVLIAIVGSAVPAWSIARIRPAEVLRTE